MVYPIYIVVKYQNFENGFSHPIYLDTEGLMNNDLDILKSKLFEYIFNNQEVEGIRKNDNTKYLVSYDVAKMLNDDTLDVLSYFKVNNQQLRTIIRKEKIKNIFI